MPSFRGQIADRQILLTAHVSKPSLKPGQEAGSVPFQALVDTGATITSISRRVVDALQLNPVGWQPIAGVHGTADTPTYILSLAVPITERMAGPDGETNHTFSRGRDPMEVALLTLQPKSFDVLLGMDLLEDFHLTIYADQFILSN